MPPAPLASVQDVADLWRPLTSDETTQATNLIVKASAMLRSRLTNIDQRIGWATSEPTNPAALDPTVVASVVATMVKRVMVNLNGVLSHSEGTGPYNQSETFASIRSGTSSTTEDLALGELVVTASDIARLTPVVTRGLPGSIRLTPGLAPAQNLVPGMPGVVIESQFLGFDEPVS